MVERHDQEDGSITYEIWDERPESYRRLCSLNEWNDGGAEDDDEEKKLILVTKMAMALASAAASDIGAEARGEAYLFALGGIPAWSVQEAILHWYTGKVRDIPEAELKWMPSPAVLLRSAQDVLKPYQDTIVKIRRLLDAKPLDEKEIPESVNLAGEQRQ